MSLPPGARLGSYEVLGPLGAGGMGEVYRAHDTRLNRDVAVKILPDTVAADPDRLARFTREAQTLAALNHPNIAHVYAVEDRAIVMELVDGEDLGHRIARGPVPIDEALPIARQIAEALEAAHERGIVHRDLKPANIKVRPDGTVKVLDFGLAKAAEPDGQAVGSGESGGTRTFAREDSPTITSPAMMTGVGMILGTAAYMSPEQAKGKAVDRRADIWAWGCVLFEMLTGRAPFAGESVTDILAKVIERDPDFGQLPVSTPWHIRRVIRRCLEKDPRQRVQHIGDARLDLDQPPGESSRPIARGASSIPLRLLPWVIAAVAAAVAALPLWRGETSTTASEVWRFDIAFPVGTEGLSSPGSVAIAPDGRTLALIANRQGLRTLFLRNIHELVSHEIRQVAGAVSVVFSPDGASMAVTTVNGEIFHVSPAENQARPVTSGADLNAIGFWSDRAIVFGRGGALWAVPPGGGQERQLTTLDSTRNEVVHASPFVLDDRLVLFTSFGSEAGSERIEAVSLDGGPRAVIVDRASTPVVSPTGHLLFGRDGALMAASFDANAGRVTGTATVVMPPGAVRSDTFGALSLALSPSGTLAVIPPDFGLRQVVSVDRKGASQPVAIANSSFANPRITRDGRRLLLEDRSSIIQTFDLVRGTLTPLATSALGTSYVVWSLDETRAVYRRFNQPFWTAADGTGRGGKLSGTTASDYPSAPGPDADSVLVSRVRPETGSDVFLTSMSGAFEPRPLIQSRAFDGGASFSPDRRWLLYQSAESGSSEIYLRQYPALDRSWQVSAGGGVQARWHPTGREIVYRHGSKMFAVSVDFSGSEPSLQMPVLLFDEQFAYASGVATPNYDVTPGGDFIMLRAVAGSSRVLVTLNWIEELKKILASGPRPR